MYSVRKKQLVGLRPSPDLVFLFLLMIAFQLPYLLCKNLLVVHDTMHKFRYFYFFYNEFYYHFEIASWVPYGEHGIPALLFQVSGLSIVNYLVGLVGIVFRVADVYLLFKVSILLEHVVLLFGAYSLSRILFKDRRTVFIVSLCVSVSTVWHSQIGWNFHIYYLMPLCLYLLLMFFMTRTSTFLWLFVICFLMSYLGIGYAFLVLAFVYGLFLFLMLIKRPVPLRYFMPRTGRSSTCP